MLELMLCLLSLGFLEIALVGITHVLSLSWTRSGESLSQILTLTADGEDNRDVSLPAGVAGHVITLTEIDVTTIVSLWISADQDVTLIFNATDTVEITADNPLQWNSGNGLPITAIFPTVAVITGLEATNNNATTAATLKMRFLFDSTP